MTHRRNPDRCNNGHDLTQPRATVSDGSCRECKRLSCARYRARGNKRKLAHTKPGAAPRDWMSDAEWTDWLDSYETGGLT